MSLIEILALSMLGVIVAFLWIALMRASVRGGCRTIRCRVSKPEEAEQANDRKEV